VKRASVRDKRSTRLTRLTPSPPPFPASLPSPGSLARQWWCNTFTSNIRAIGTVLLVLTPALDPIPLQRGNQVQISNV
jgi:hypothetical protein